jgi:hypothetical protein
LNKYLLYQSTLDIHITTKELLFTCPKKHRYETELRVFMNMQKIMKEKERKIRKGKELKKKILREKRRNNRK